MNNISPFLEYDVVCAREELEYSGKWTRSGRVASQLDMANLFITADTYYELYVNGLFVNRGPARSAPHHQSYDILDIASMLKAGENVMALRVFHKGRDTLNAITTARPGILAQLEIQSKSNQQIITSNSSWKVKEPEGMYLYTSDFGESKDFLEEESQWKEKDFDDSHWGEAQELINETFWPKPSPGERARTITYPWLSLVPRDIPYLKESLVKASCLHEVGEILELSYSEPVAAGAHGLIFPIEENTLRGIEAYKAGEGSITIKNRYGNMKKDGSQTLWEEWSLTVSKRTGRFEPNNKRANAQGENTFPAYSLTRWVLGVQPVKPGMAEVILSCNLCGHTEVKGAMPSPKGNIHVAWKNGKKGISLEVEVPDGMHVKVDLNSEDLREKKMMSLDGQNFVINKLSSGTIEVPAGRHILKFY